MRRAAECAIFSGRLASRAPCKFKCALRASGQGAEEMARGAHRNWLITITGFLLRLKLARLKEEAGGAR